MQNILTENNRYDISVSEKGCDNCMEDDLDDNHTTITDLSALEIMDI